MKITKRQLRRIIQESLPYRKGQPWTDPKAPVGVARTEDDLDRELTDAEIETSMGFERADSSGDTDFWAGYGDATDGLGLPVGASPDYKAGWEDGNLNRITESRRRAKFLKEYRPGVGSATGDDMSDEVLRQALQLFGPSAIIDEENGELYIDTGLLDDEVEALYPDWINLWPDAMHEQGGLVYTGVSLDENY